MRDGLEEVKRQHNVDCEFEENRPLGISDVSVRQEHIEGVNGSQQTSDCETNSTHDATRQGEKVQQPIEVLRRSGRAKQQPKYLEQYETELPQSIDHSLPTTNPGTSEVCLSSQSVFYDRFSKNHKAYLAVITAHDEPNYFHQAANDPLSHFISFDRSSKDHKAYLTAITTHDEPKYFYQAIKDDRWCEAMKKEIKALEENGTWTLEKLPPGKKAIDSKWVYKIKYKPNGDIERYKARLVAKGFTQIEGIDFHETFAPVAKLVTMRSLLVVAAKQRWAIH